MSGALQRRICSTLSFTTGNGLASSSSNERTWGLEMSSKRSHPCPIPSHGRSLCTVTSVLLSLDSSFPRGVLRTVAVISTLARAVSIGRMGRHLISSFHSCWESPSSFKYDNATRLLNFFLLSPYN